ncbi:MAG TPA: FkbM family methyltransferase [Verrucomicrobiae bacterium]|nr:FkbM family methyltransferase [Verrucomicrobiae bacterium]
MKTPRDICMGILLKTSWALRRNPARFLFSDKNFSRVTGGEQEEVEFLKRRWQENGSGTIWDVGASLGKYTCDIARANPNCKIFAFEPNLNSIYFLAHRAARFSTIEIVPTALTADGRDMKGSYEPNFGAPATGPFVPTFSLAEALAKFGKPVFIKLDVEGEEFRIFRDHQDLLRGVHLLVEWHQYFANETTPELKHWRVHEVWENHTYLEPIAEK